LTKLEWVKITLNTRCSREEENAQKRIESRNFDARKSLLEYDDVSNDQRQAIYSLRNQLLVEQDISDTIQALIEDQFKLISYSYVPEGSVESQWRTKDLEKYLIETYNLETNIHQKVIENKKLIPESIAKEIVASAKNRYEYKYLEFEDNRLLLEKQVMLQVLDVHWKEHLAEIDHLRNSIGLRAYAQKNPKNEFKREAYSMFESMLNEIDSGTIRILYSLQIAKEENVNTLKQNQSNEEIVYQKDEAPNINEDQSSLKSANPQETPETIKRESPKIGRNDFVKITNGEETKEVKFKKAKPLIESGNWKII